MNLGVNVGKEVPNVKVYEKPPSGFMAKVEVSACFLEVRERLLLLQNLSTAHEPDRWGVPAGKVEKGESIEAAAVRELFEETAIRCSQAKKIGSLYMRRGELDYIFHLFVFDLEEMESVTLSSVHEGYLWASKEDLEVIPLMAGAKETLRFYEKVLRKKES